MFGRETISSLRDAAQRVNSVGYDASQLIEQIEPVRLEAEDTLATWKTAGQVVTIAAAVVAACALLGLGIYAYREL